MALNSAAIDTRIKATVTSTMYDMSRINANGYFDEEKDEQQRFEKNKYLIINVRVISLHKILN